MKGKKLSSYLLFAILGGFVAWTVWGRSEIDIDVESYEIEIQMLQQRVDSIREQNIALKLQADSLHSEIAEYDQEIDKLNSKIYVIKEETNTKVAAVDRFGDDELERFFADRYNKNKPDSVN